MPLTCLSPPLAPSPLSCRPLRARYVDEALGWAEAKLAGLYCNAPRNATKIKVNVKLDPFTAMGQAWVRAMRVAMAEAEAAPMSEWGSGDGGVEREPKALGRFYLTGVAPEQMDGAAACDKERRPRRLAALHRKRRGCPAGGASHCAALSRRPSAGAAYTFGALPKMVAVTLSIVCLVLGVAFRSALVPLRAVVCLVWMLCVVFGAAVRARPRIQPWAAASPSSARARRRTWGLRWPPNAPCSRRRWSRWRSTSWASSRRSAGRRCRRRAARSSG